MTEETWKLKLAAWLHDPPGKAFDIAGHYFASESLMRNFGLTHKDFPEHAADHVAASADRFPFPHHSVFRSDFTGGKDSPFRHPFGGEDLQMDKPFAGAAVAEEEANKSFTGDGIQGVDSWQEKFWLLWRRWPEQAALQDPRLAFLPADTRIPDHTIWNHNSTVSALETCRVGRELKPAFLMFQAGPVQSFISEARSTRDLWSGSYLLSWLMASALHEVATQAGPDSVIFPALRGLPLLDVMNKPMWDKIRFGKDSLWSRMFPDGAKTEAQRLTAPTIPNRFLAVVPADRVEEIAKAAKAAFIGELKKISETVWKQFDFRASENGYPLSSDVRKRFDRQVELWPQITWQVMPWNQPETARDMWKKIRQEDPAPILNLEKIIELGKGTPYSDKPGSQQGLHWPVYVALSDYALAARRNTREFSAYDTDAHQEDSPKDPLNGREEIVGGRELWTALQNDKVFEKENSGLGAMSIIKRLWCRSETGFLNQRLGFSDRELIDTLHVKDTEKIAERNYNPNNPYIAILALDGDEMGKWMSGENAPLLKEVLSKEALTHYGDRIEDVKRPLSPGYHLQFSEALATFATRFVDPIVRDCGGQLILAGGDDVLAMLPADKALSCAVMLRAAFRGKSPDELFKASPRFQRETLNQAWDIPFDPWDGLHGGWAEETIDGKEVPRAMPGLNADVSVGIAVAHKSHPLQHMIQAAQSAEKAAKNDYGRAACQVRLLKRGGEEIHWGFKWKSGAIELYQVFSDLSLDEGKISGKFPSALAQRFTAHGFLGSRKTDYAPAFLQSLPDLIRVEFQDVLQRQGEGLSQVEKENLLRRFETALTWQPPPQTPPSKPEPIEKRVDDILKLFLASAFMTRQQGEDA
ncbi:MAG: type III-B CRISPR-associated protein Cas10/Cmr2 [Verrucomicrobia bacterium]|nr:type III-B CRISPR-associated protein Cas10/Cmr2 [Verrucomicrobiota bacterium]MCH8528792.1 type III-B CRISPR-associated protein Cas10/Cmr2 [Kiritimatiellia bacterium]